MHPIYAGDLAKALVSAVLKEEITRNQEYDVAGKTALKYIRFTEADRASVGETVRFLHIPYKLALLAGKIGDKIPNRIITHEKVLRLNEDKNFDYSKATRELDFRPISFEEAILPCGSHGNEEERYPVTIKLGYSRSSGSDQL